MGPDSDPYLDDEDPTSPRSSAPVKAAAVVDPEPDTEPDTPCVPLDVLEAFRRASRDRR